MMKWKIRSVRLILYILFATGGILVAVAMIMVFVKGNVAEVETKSQKMAVAAPIKKNKEIFTNAKKTAESQVPNIQPNLNAPVRIIIDIARVMPRGDSVFAGTALPNASIRIFEGKALLGKTIANTAGEWVIVLEKSLAVGQHLISIAMGDEDGTAELADRSLAIEIFKDGETKPLVALLPKTAAEVPVLFQSPDDGAPAITVDSKNLVPIQPTPSIQASMESGLITIAPTAIVWRDASRVLISGLSNGGARVVVTDANGPFGEALVLADGAWQIGGSLDIKTVQHRLQFTLLDNKNMVVASYNLPIKSRDLAKGRDGSLLVVVNKGDALWRIAYRRFGDGIRYIDIVRRNQMDIENADLIYPKQIFAMPKPARDIKN